MTDTTAFSHRLVIVSNRLPVVVHPNGDGTWRCDPSSGGLVTALSPVLQQRSGLWIGWPGSVVEDGVDLDATLKPAARAAGYDLVPVLLTALERDKFYLGFSNEIIWPLFHDLQSRCNFDPSYWAAYEHVNQTFARVTAQTVRAGDYIWVQDYHLINLAAALRKQGVDSPIGFFLHIPFPPPDIFMKLPWREQVLRGMLAYDLIGFQTMRDRQNFVQCVQTLLDDVTIGGRHNVITAHLNNRAVGLGVFPIGIDYQSFADLARSAAVANAAHTLRAELGPGQLIFSADRLDYTKGIPQKLEAFRHALMRYPELRRQLTLTQVVVPSRMNIPEYDNLKLEIEQLVGAINGQFTEPGWVPIHYRFRNLSPTELVAYYLASDVALITPLKDGMNLVAKEYCASHHDGGALILSEFAGAATQLECGALLVNPYHADGIADAIAHASTMGAEERQRRMGALRRVIGDHDVFWWVETFLTAAGQHYLRASVERAATCCADLTALPSG
jgi:trehalose 6-phosphate synthase